MASLRIAFFGMEGTFSGAPLAALLTSEHAVCAVVVPPPAGVTNASTPMRVLPPPSRRPHELPLAAVPVEATVVGLAWADGIPVLELGSLSHPQVLAALRDLRPDVLCVACFPRLLPPELLSVARHGGLNVHPSLLPDYRGPSPLFWVFHDGLEHAGVTVHVMDAGADTGDVVGQAPVALPDGIAYSRAERMCAEQGARLLVKALHALAADALPRAPQPRVAAPRAPTPTDADFVVTPGWSARRAFNFIRGLAEWNPALRLQVGHERFVVREAVAFDEAAELRAPVQRSGRHLAVQCSPGVLTLTCHAPWSPPSCG